MALVGAPSAAPTPPHTLGLPLDTLRQVRPTRGFKLPASVRMPVQPNLEQYLASAAAGRFAPPASLYPQIRAFSPELLRAAAH